VRRKHTTQEQPPPPAQLPQTLEPRPQPWTPESHHLFGQGFLEHM
jgi:hypothetical protein